MKRFFHFYAITLAVTSLLFLGIFCAEYIPSSSASNNKSASSIDGIDINNIGGYTTTITRFVGTNALRYQTFLSDKSSGKNVGAGIRVGEYSADPIGYFSVMHIGHSSDFPLWMNIRLNGKVVNFADAGTRGVLGLPPLTTKEMSEFYGKDVRISFDASKDKIQDTFYGKDKDMVVVVDNSVYRDAITNNTRWGANGLDMPAVDEHIYIPQYIAWTPSGIESQNDAELKLPYTITWNADSKNQNGVAILIEYDPRNQQTINSLASKENEIFVPIEVQDNGSFVLTTEHFEQIPNHALVKITLVRGAYKFLNDLNTDRQYPVEFNSSASALFMDLQK